MALVIVTVIAMMSCGYHGDVYVDVAHDTQNAFAFTAHIKQYYFKQCDICRCILVSGWGA
jgi:hypothetical protein